MAVSQHVVVLFNDTATTEIYALSLHDALPISTSTPTTTRPARSAAEHAPSSSPCTTGWLPSTGSRPRPTTPDRKSTRLNSSHANISYAVFCLKNKNTSTILQ